MINLAKFWRVALGAIAASGATATVALADPQAPPQKEGGHSCYYVNQWESWKSPDPSTIYLRINLHDYYVLKLSAPSDWLQMPTAHLISRVVGPTIVCSAVDFDLKVADDHGIPEPLFVESMAKLTPEQVAAIPKKDLPP